RGGTGRHRPRDRRAGKGLAVRPRRANREGIVQGVAGERRLAVARHARQAAGDDGRPSRILAGNAEHHEEAEGYRPEPTKNAHSETSCHRGTTRYSNSPSRIMPNSSRATRSCTMGFVSRSLAAFASESTSTRSAATLSRSSASWRRIVSQSAVLYSPPHAAIASKTNAPASPAIR